MDAVREVSARLLRDTHCEASFADAAWAGECQEAHFRSHEKVICDDSLILPTDQRGEVPR